MGGKTRISRRKIAATLVELLDNGRSCKDVAKLLAAYLVKTGQAREAELYIRDLESMIAERFGIATVRVYSAKRLSQQIRSQVKKLVKNSTGASKLELIEVIEPTLIGGIVIRTADAELDRSVRTKLQRLRSI